MTGAVYRSPLRPLDIGYLARRYDIEIDWATTDIGDWTPVTRYGFTGELPAAAVDQLSLERAEPVRASDVTACRSPHTKNARPRRDEAIRSGSACVSCGCPAAPYLGVMGRPFAGRRLCITCFDHFFFQGDAGPHPEQPSDADGRL